MKLLQSLVFLLVISGFSNCKDQRSKPELDREVMVEVLTDVYLLEGARALNLQGIGRDTLRSTKILANIYAKHGVDKDAFLASYRVYAQDQEKLEALMEDVMGRLGELEAKELGRRANPEDSTSNSNRGFFDRHGD